MNLHNKKYNKVKCLIASSFILPLLTPAQGAELSELSFNELLQVTVATKDRKSLFKAPANVTVFTRQDINNYGFATLQQLLNFVPGFNSARDIEQGSMHRISVRGRSTSLSESVLVLLNGQRLGDLYSGGATLLNRELSLSNVAKVEIIRGPGSALYGSNAFLGVINIITRKTGNELEFEVGSFGRKRSYFQTSDLLEGADEWTVSLEAVSEHGDQYFISDSFGINQSTRDPWSGLDFSAEAIIKNWTFHSRFMERELEKFLVFGNHGDQNKELMRQWSISLAQDNRVSDDWQFTTQLSLSRDTWDTRATLIPAGVEIAPQFSLEQDFIGGPYLRTQSLQLQMDHSVFLTAEHALLLGVQLHENKVLDVANVTTHNPITLDYFGELRYNRDDLNFSKKQTRTIGSIYAQHQWELSDDWQLTSGVRLDDYSDFGHTINPRMALVWSYAKHSSVKFLYATAFRAPNFLELYDRNNPVDFGNPELNPEKVRTSEVAWLSQNKQWRYELNVFHNQYEDLIQLGPAMAHPDNPLLAPTFFNMGKSDSTGAEAVLRYQINSTAELTTNWSWLSNNRFIHSPLVQWSLQGIKRWDKHSMALTATRYSNNKQISGQLGYSLIDAHWRVSLPSDGKLELTVKNLLNKEYSTQTSILSDGIINRSRQWTLSITFPLD